MSVPPILNNLGIIGPTGLTGSNKFLKLLSPPICLQVFYKNVLNGMNPNEYKVTIISTTQTHGRGYYDCSSILPGMYTGNSENGYIL